MKEPETQLIAITFADDTVAIMAFITKEFRPNGEVRWERIPLDHIVDAEIERIAFDKAVKAWAFIERSDIPEDRSYRNALRFDGKKFNHDLEHAKEIHKDKLRKMREPKLLELDIEYQRADEANDPKRKAEITKEKQALRDITDDPRIAKAMTIDDLKKLL